MKQVKVYENGDLVQFRLFADEKEMERFLLEVRDRKMNVVARQFKKHRYTEKMWTKPAPRLSQKFTRTAKTEYYKASDYALKNLPKLQITIEPADLLLI